jgi:exonuclease VII small subunit
MVVKTAVEYINDSLVERLKDLQRALNQAETIIQKLEIENQNLKMVLSNYEQDELLMI